MRYIAGPGGHDEPPLFTITQVNNGFVVKVYIPEQERYLRMRPEDMALIRAAKGEDEVMERIKKVQEEALQQPKAKDVKVENIHIFSTIKQVTEFINYIML